MTMTHGGIWPLSLDIGVEAESDALRLAYYAVCLVISSQ
jgi:hypothetical protein